jgi:TPR repeat protein
MGFEYMLKCAEKNDKNSVFYVARAFDTGVGLCKPHSIDWSLAVKFYKRMLKIVEEESQANGGEDSGYCEVITDLCEPSYSVLARLGEMHLKGGNSLEMNANLAYSYFNDAAEKATLCGKGRLANKYYMQAEEASSMCE